MTKTTETKAVEAEKSTAKPSKTRVATKPAHTPPAVVDQATSIMEIIGRMATDPSADIDKFERLLAISTEIEARNARKEFFDALATFQEECPSPKKSKTAKVKKDGRLVYTYTYSSLDDIVAVIKHPLSKNGLSYRFEQSVNGTNMIEITCVVTHRAGHEERNSMAGGADNSGGKNAIQQIASTVTYLRRYTLTGALGVAATDEDLDGDTGEDGEGEYIPAQRHPEPQAARQTREAPARSAEIVLPELSQEKFNGQWDTWVANVEAGKSTPASIIAKTSTRFTLSEAQKASILEIGVAA
jgi:hypothetical protein